jgi:membrane protease YdiL (CAAX protease family)
VTDPILTIALSSLVVESILLTLALAAALLLPGPPRERLGWVRGRLGVAMVAVLAVGMLGLSHALDALLALSGLLEQSDLAGFARTLHGARGLPLAAAILAIGLVPALAEELLFRGVLQRSLVARLGAVPGIGLAAVAFGAIHVEPIHATFAVPLGVYLGLAGYLAGNVWVPVACHAVNNLAAVAAAVVQGATVTASPADVALGVAVAAAALGFVSTRVRGLQPTLGSDDG